jgi:exodeoxyribonuclease VII large subunit
LDRAHQRVDRLTHRAGHPAALLKVQSQRLRSISQRLQRGLIVSCERRDQQLRSLQPRALRALQVALQTQDRRLAAVAQRLAMVHPQRVLQRGYAWLEDPQGVALTSVRSLASGQSMVAVLADGRVQAQVQEVVPNPP